MSDFRCSATSEIDGEPLAGSAPTETRWLFVDQPAGWEPKVTLTHPLARVQLIRRPGGGVSGDRPRVFWADLRADLRADLDGSGVRVRAGRVDEVADAGVLDPATLAPYDGPLWLVCAHGRRDVCCAERGRPVAAALAARWPEETWETTHLGGHRFAATLLSLPSGIARGRLDADTAVSSAEALLAGELPDGVVRGRAGTPAAVQVAEASVRERDGLTGLDDVHAEAGPEGDVVTVRTPAGSTRVRVEQGPAVPRRQSCAEDRLKPAPTYTSTLC